MGQINFTYGNDHRLRVEMTRWDAPLALSQSSDVRVYAVSRFGEKTQLVVHYSANDEGVLEAEWPAVLKAGCYGLIVTGFLEGEGQWTMRAGDAVKVTTVTEKGSESLTMIADSYDVKATITVCVGTKGVTEELRQEIADMIEEEYNASERVRESNEHDREEAELIREHNEETRQQNEQGRVEAEQLREQAEGERQTTFETNERKRQGDYEEAEGTRNQSYQTAEEERDSAYQTKEGERNQNYQQSEGQRNQTFQQAEALRQQKEGERQQAEQGRAQAEQGRNNAEITREDNEGKRVLAEQGRVEAEELREQTFATYKPQIDAKLDAPTEEEFNAIFN